MIVIEPTNILPKGEWRNETFFKVTDPSNGGWWCFNLEVRVGTRTTIYENLTDDGTWWKRLWHWFAGHNRRHSKDPS